MKVLDDDGALGVTASLVALKLERFTRREATLVAAQTLAVTGNALSGLWGLGNRHRHPAEVHRQAKPNPADPLTKRTGANVSACPPPSAASK